jgi:hypothetical protein
MSKPRRITELQLTTNPSISDLIALARAGSNSRVTIGTLLNSEFPTTLGNTTINGDLIVNGTETIISSSVLYDSGSTIFGNSTDDIHDFIGDVTITGSLFVSGTTELGGDLIPQTPQGGTLGTIDKPFRDLFLQSGSISIESDTPGDPSAFISNNGGNLDISVGGMRLVEPGNSFIAETGSFSFISGSMTQIGDYILYGDKIIEGELTVTGSVDISGSLNTTGSSVFGGDVDVQGDFYHKGNKQYNYGQFYSLETQSGSADTAYAMKYEVTDGTSGVSITNNASGLPTRITPTNTGVYNIQFSNQLGNTANSDITFDIWFRINEVNVPNSNTKFSLIKSLGSGLYEVAALNFLTQLNAGQYVEIMWSCGASTGQFEYLGTQSTPTRPATPSIILTVTQIS